MVAAAVTDILERRRAQGASTLTQQLARNLKDHFGLTSKSQETTAETLERKIKEIILAIQIEKRYTKKEIFTIYCNQMYLGHGPMASKPPPVCISTRATSSLSLEEAALIAGIFQTPERQSPFVDMSARHHAETSCCSGWRTSATSPRRRRSRETEADRDARPAHAAARHCAVLREDVRKHLERQYARRCCTKTASR